MSKTMTVKVKKKKINYKRILLSILIIYIIGYAVYLLVNIPIKNIIISNNDIVPDNDVIRTASLDKYPSFLLTNSGVIKSKLKVNPYIKSVTVKKEFFNQLYLEVNEYKAICLTKNNKVILENATVVDNSYNMLEIPTLINDIDANVINNFATKFSLVNPEIMLKISQIYYDPVTVDKERFLLYMNDGNSVYITLAKIEELNKYDDIYIQLDGKKGILYLDSGEYFEIKE